MKKVITAIGSEELNKIIKYLDDIEVKEKDIFYIEGIFEYLEKDSDIDIIIINEELCDNLIVFIQKIKIYNIELFIILKNEHYVEEFEKYKNIKFFNNEEDVVKYLENKEYLTNKFSKTKIKNKKRIISITGNSGVGKTIFCSLIGKCFADDNKVLLINFDFNNNDLKILFNSNYIEKNYMTDNLIIKQNNNLYILNEIKYVFNELIEANKMKEFFNKLKEEYDYIFLDLSTNLNCEYLKYIFYYCDYNIFLVEPNNLEIKKSQNILELYVCDLGLQLEKIGLLINKYNNNSTDINSIKDGFENIKILGKMKYNSKINSYINTFTKDNLKIKELNKIKEFIL